MLVQRKIASLICLFLVVCGVQAQAPEQVASHGYLVIAPGGIYSGPGATPRLTPEAQGIDVVVTTPAQLGQAIDWALAENVRAGSPYYGKIDPSA